MNMYTLGHDFVPPGIHAGGLRYHGDSPIISKLVHEGRMEAVAHRQRAVFEANVLFARVEGDYFTVLGMPLLEILNYLTLRGDLQQ